jgi:aryl-alcohol dehydrogenase-like predicted oxidoreductase
MTDTAALPDLATSQIKHDSAEIEHLATPFKVSRIGLGTWAIGGWMWGGTDETAAIGVIHEAVDRGVTLIDTAPAYGFGRSEEIVGKALAEGGRRQHVVIATKVGLDWKDGQPFRDARKRRIHKEIDDSLRRLRTDVIDLYQVHWPDPNVPIEETAAAMAELQRAGKIRYIGVSNFSPAQIEAFRKVAPVQTVQSPYNLFERAIEEDVLPYCRDKSIATLAYGSLCRGLLSGRMTAQTSLPATTCERSTQSSARLDLSNTFGPSRGSIGSPRPITESASSILLCVGFSTGRTRRLRSGARAGLTNSPPSRASRASISTRPPWPRSIGSFQKRS